jgi:phosphorylase kinase alpha/beta subunit
MIAIQNQRLFGLLRPVYDRATLASIADLLAQAGTFEFPALPSGLFAASQITDANRYTGYGAVWVRDNVQIARAQLLTGRADVAARTGRALLAHFQRQRTRMEAIVVDPALADTPMNRPHVRFDGVRNADLPEVWPHAQNDALGYFLWLVGTLSQQNALQLAQEDWACLETLLRYLDAIAYWRDEDSGHWEETRKVSASSIGAVVAGIREVAGAAARQRIALGHLRPDVTARLSGEGLRALSVILPAECVQPGRARLWDAALLFLNHPLNVLTVEQAERVIGEVGEHLVGDVGIRRYRGDSFWFPDYKQKLPEERRTSDSSDSLDWRDAGLAPGLEAQWCLFDPLLSTIHGRRFRATGDPRDRQRQVEHLNRGLGQLTGASSGFPELRCPELYYLEDGRWMPSDATPLLWTEALLLEAMEELRQTVEREGRPPQSRSPAP